MKRLKLFFAALALAFCLVPATPALAATNVFDETCKQSGARQSSACGTSGANPVTGNNGILTRVTRLIALIAGIAAVILIIVSGVMFASSQGDASKIASARTTLIYAVVGLVIVAVAQSIIVLVLNNLY